MGYGGYYGPSPWGYYRGPACVGGGGVPDIPDRPVAMPMPDLGMLDMSPSAGFADFGDF